MAKLKEPKQGVYVPDAEITAVIERWHGAKQAIEAAQAAEEKVFGELNRIADERVGEQQDATFIVARLGDLEPAKAGRTYPERGKRVDYDQVAQLIEERLGASTARKYFTAERVVVQHPNEAALAAAAASDPRIAGILELCTTPGTPTLTRVPPAKAGKDLAASAVPLPARKQVRVRRVA